MFDQLGAALFGSGPTQPATAQPQQQNTWSSFLQDPVNRAGLLQFGITALSGGWGTTGQQMAQALGHGAEAAAGQEAILQAQAEKDTDRALRTSEGALERSSREKIADKNNEGRLEVARTRVEGMLNRTQMNLSKAEQPIILKYRKLATDTMGKTFAALQLPPEQFAALIDKEAERMYTEDVMSGRASPPKSAPSSPTTETTPSPDKPGVKPSTKTPAAAAKPAPTSAKKLAPWSAVLADPEFETEFAKPEVRKELAKKYGMQVGLEERKRGLPPVNPTPADRIKDLMQGIFGPNTRAPDVMPGGTP